MAMRGRPRASVDPAALAAAWEAVGAGRLSKRRAAAELGIGRATLRRLLQNFGHAQEGRKERG
jgi:DNA-binding NtrC family response regulator